MIIRYDKLDRTVDALHKLGINVAESNWVLSILNADPRAATAANGIYQNGEWGFATVVEPNSRGEWIIPDRFGRLHG